MAGLPKSAAVVAILIIAGLSFLGLAQDVQTPSVVIDPTDDPQTSSSPLQPVYDLIAINPDVTAEQSASLVAAFEAAYDAGTLSPDQAVEMLALVGWETLTADGDLGSMLEALQTALAGLASGDITDDPLAALTDILNLASMPEGTLNALTKAGVADENLSEVAALVADGMPPGILVRVVKDALRDDPDADPGDISALLAALEAASEEEQGWGQAANEATGQGEFKHNEKEENKNNGKNEEPETEKNNNGNGKGKDT